MRIRKTTVTVIFLHRDDEDLSGCSLPDLLGRADTCDLISGITHHSAEDVPNERVHAELLAIGNDGEWFGPIAPSREALIERLREDWLDCVARDGADTVNALLDNGFKGFRAMTYEELYKEADDSGLIDEDEEADSSR